MVFQRFVFVFLVFAGSIFVMPPTDFAPQKGPFLFVPLGLPVTGPLSSSFGVRRHPLKGGLHFHEGVDIRSPLSGPVRATAAGKIEWSGFKGGYGWLVVVDHGRGWKTRYAHLKPVRWKRGQNVGQGNVVGYIGDSGLATGPHLHYEVLYDDIPQNPLLFSGGSNFF